MRYLMLLVLCLTASSALAQSAGIDRIDITAYGIMAGPPGVRNGVGTYGIEHRLARANVIETTTTIPACIGTRFGIAFSVVGTPGAPPENIVEVYRFPPSGLNKPGLLSPIHESHFERALISGNRDDGIFYEFDDPWELVTGEWTFEIRDGNRVLASKTFVVVTPKTGECQGLSV
jgi:hypothetical protein